jgi:transposase
MKRFEYIIARDITPLQLERIGLNGWELVCVVERDLERSARFMQYFFKRELANSEEETS